MAKVARATVLVSLLLPGCKIVKNVDLAKDRNSPDSFDAAAYVTKIWTPAAIAEFKANSVDLLVLLPAIEADPDKAGRTYGHGGGGGNPWSYQVKGEGKVTAVDVGSRHGIMTVAIPTAAGPRSVELQIGPVIFGTALRDSLPSVRFGDFVNQIQFAQVSRALNDTAAKDVRNGFDPAAAGGKTVQFYGASTAQSSGGTLAVTPLAIMMVPAP